MRIPAENDIAAVIKSGNEIVAYFINENDANQVARLLNAAAPDNPYWVADFIPDEPRDDPEADADDRSDV